MSALCYCYSRDTQGHKAIVKWLGARFRPSQIMWYVDKPGKNAELSQMLKDISNDSPKTVVVYSLDQICKSLADGLGILVGLLNNNGRIVAINPQVDITGPAAAELLVAIAKMEKDARRAKQTAGIEAAKARGVYKGRSDLSSDPQRAKELQDKGMTYGEIAKELGVSMATVCRYLRRVRS